MSSRNFLKDEVGLLQKKKINEDRRAHFGNENKEFMLTGTSVKATARIRRVAAAKAGCT